jgi:hypothetical protein
MPLHDHFHPPLSERRPWESFHSTWCGSPADYLNRGALPPGYIALEQVRAGAPVEIDVSTWEEGVPARGPTGNGATAVAPAVWTPAAPPVLLPAVFPPGGAVAIVDAEGGRTLADRLTRRVGAADGPPVAGGRVVRPR